MIQREYAAAGFYYCASFDTFYIHDGLGNWEFDHDMEEDHWGVSAFDWSEDSKNWDYLGDMSNEENETCEA